MHRAVDVGTRLQDAGVEVQPGRAEHDAVVADDLAVERHRRQIGGGDLVPAEPERVHQEVVGAVGDADADVVVDLQVPAVVVGQAERGRGLDADFPLGLGHLVAAGAGLELRLGDHVHGSLLVVARIIVAPGAVWQSRQEAIKTTLQRCKTAFARHRRASFRWSMVFPRNRFPLSGPCSKMAAEERLERPCESVGGCSQSWRRCWRLAPRRRRRRSTRTRTSASSSAPASRAATLSYARLLAAHMGNHIPGKPDFIVQSMPGAGGLLATNYLFAQAPQDGTTIGLIHSTVPLGAAVRHGWRALRSAENPLARQHGPLRRSLHGVAHVADQDLGRTCSTRSSSSAHPASARRWTLYPGGDEQAVRHQGEGDRRLQGWLVDLLGHGARGSSRPLRPAAHLDRIAAPAMADREEDRGADRGERAPHAACSRTRRRCSSLPRTSRRASRSGS